MCANKRRLLFSRTPRRRKRSITWRRWVPASAWIDYDQDGLMDLYFRAVGGDRHLQAATSTAFGALSQQWGRHFHRCDRAKAGVDGEGHYGQGVAVGDFDNDGYPDMYVTGYGRAILVSQQRQRDIHRRHREERCCRRRRMVDERRMVRLRQRWLARSRSDKLHRLESEKQYLVRRAKAGLSIVLPSRQL